MAYYIAPRFLDTLAVHITKNYLKLPEVKIPLIMGVHGRKGEGKTFQCELVYERMGVEVVPISGGELESPDAGDPARLIRLRYREAAELVRVRGKMAVLMINDIDAGAGRFDALTQYTGNDLSTLYAPLIRDGRMEKFYWEPDRSDRIGIVGGIFAPDGLSSQDVTMLVDTFPHQAIDFFGAVRAQIYNEQIRDFIDAVGIENVSRSVVNTLTPPTFRKPDFTLSHLIEVGYRLVGEQRRVDDSHLANEYNRVLQSGHAAAGTGPFYRAYPAANGSPAVSSPEHRAADDNSAACPLPAVQNSKFNVQTISALPAEVGDQINRPLAD
jgi:hypothetical protein